MNLKRQCCDSRTGAQIHPKEVLFPDREVARRPCARILIKELEPSGPGAVKEHKGWPGGVDIELHRADRVRMYEDLRKACCGLVRGGDIDEIAVRIDAHA